MEALARLAAETVDTVAKTAADEKNIAAAASAGFAYDPALASVTSWVRPFRQWLVSPKQLAWFVPRCSSVSHLPKRLRLSDSWCSSFSSSPEIRRTLKESHYPSNAAQELTC